MIINFFMSRRLPLLCMLIAQAGSVEAQIRQQDPAQIQAAVEKFFLAQTSGIPGQKSINVGKIDKRLNLAACAQPEPFLPSGSRAWGQTTVGVRCTSPAAWTIYLQAEVKIVADYIVTATQIANGQEIQASDLSKLRGDLSRLPADVVTDEAPAIGKTANFSLRPGVPLRMSALRNQFSVKQGQAVRLLSTGPGFQIMSEGWALANAGEGQEVQVRTRSGKIVTGTAKSGGIVEVIH